MGLASVVVDKVPSTGEPLRARTSGTFLS
jgi:hypothetical protein